MFAVLQCWLRDPDGLVFLRDHLERLLGLERFKDTRVDWLQEDLCELFPYAEVFRRTEPGKPFHSLYVSRKVLAPFLASGSMTDQQRIARIPANGPHIGFFQMWSSPSLDEIEHVIKPAVPFFADSANYDERFLDSYLTLLCQGQISPRSITAMRP
jgi:hypothetical protein